MQICINVAHLHTAACILSDTTIQAISAATLTLKLLQYFNNMI